VAFSTVSIMEAQMNEGMRQRIPWKAAIRPLLGLVICIAMAPSIALGVPIDEYGPGVADPFADPTATFTFAVPDPVPGKLSGGGWGALFLKFDKTISSATFVTDPVLASCRDNPMVFGAGTKQLSIGCNTASGAYLFNNQTARDLRMTVTVTSDDPGPIHLIFERNSPSDGTFWAQKRLKVTGGPASGQATNVNPLLENATLDGTLPITLIPNAPSKGISVTCQMSNGNVDNAGECLTLLNRPVPLTFALAEAADDTTPEPGVALFFNGASFKTPGGFNILDPDGSVSDQLGFGDQTRVQTFGRSTLRYFSGPNNNIDLTGTQPPVGCVEGDFSGCSFSFQAETMEGDSLIFVVSSDFNSPFGPPGGLGASDIISIAVVPEPSTLLVLATGCVGLLALGWRRRRHGNTGVKGNGDTGSGL